MLISKALPRHIFFARRGFPLQVRFAPGDCFFASLGVPLLGYCEKTIDFDDSIQLFDAASAAVEPISSPLSANSLAAQKEGSRYFMEKEIYEQPRVQNRVVVQEEFPTDWLPPFASITLIACGTGYHVALVGSYLLERLARVPTKVKMASEFRYRQPVLDPRGPFVVISQSGEMADTLEVLKLAKAQELATLALCNADNSSIARTADETILLGASIEKGVASTEEFSAQVMILWLLALYGAQVKDWLDGVQQACEMAALHQSVEVMKMPASLHERIHQLSKRYLHGHGFSFIGRNLFYPLAFEGALKLKEISYLHAESNPDGDMKHRPIQLADAKLFAIALMAKSIHYDKVKSNLEELSARNSIIIAITTECFDLAYDIIQIRAYDHPMLEFFEMLGVVQFLTIKIAIWLCNDVEMLRNLAKSVTVA